MIINHRYRFIFIKTNKTAGTSVEIALSKYCEPGDIVTPISVEDEIIRRSMGGLAPQNYLEKIWRYRMNDWLRLIRHQERKKRYFNHMSAGQVKNLVQPSIWDNYYKFCIERDPFDRAVSQYFWRLRSENRPYVPDFFTTKVGLKLLADLKAGGIENYTIDSQIAVDKVCRYENLDEDLGEVAIKVGLPDKLELPRAKSGFRSDRRSPHELLSVRDREVIRNVFHKEIEWFGY